MAHAEIGDVAIVKIFDSKYASGAKAVARRTGEQALKGAFDLGAPKTKDERYWSLDLKLTVSLDADKRRLSAGCGVFMNIGKGSNKVLHKSKPPNRAEIDANPAKITQRDVDDIVVDAVKAALEQPVAVLKADTKTL